MGLFPIPSMLLRQLYTYNSLRNSDVGISFSIKNRLTDVTFTGLRAIEIDGSQVSLENVTMDLGSGNTIKGSDISEGTPIDFPLKKVVEVSVSGISLDPGKHKIKFKVKAKGYGKLKFEVEDSIPEVERLEVRIPRAEDDYSPEIIAKRRAFVEEQTGANLEHVSNFSFDPHALDGNCENFTGVAQVPIGFAGPVKVNGEFADGEFLIPLATTEGTLVAFLQSRHEGPQS